MLLAVTVQRASRATDVRPTLMTASTTSVKTTPHVLIWCRRTNVAVLQASWVSSSLSFISVSTRVYCFMTKLAILFSLVPLFIRGTWWCRWLRHYATSQNVAGSIPDGVTGIFH